MTASSEWGLPPALMDVAFPFHVVLDRDLVVVQVGPSIARLHAAPMIGKPMSELFAIATPKGATTFDAYAANPRALFLLQSSTIVGLVLRGQMIVDPAAGRLCFVGSPWLTTPSDFANLGLTLGDFAVSDGVVDYVLLLQHQSSSLVAARELADQLNASAEQLTHQAFHDALTGLPNRALLLDQVTRLLKSGDIEHQPTIALLLLDLDGFKGVNDSYGHSAGDGVLVVVAERLRAIAREGDIVARFGGDEFALVIGSSGRGARLSARTVNGVAERLLGALQQPISLPSAPSVTVELSGSIGVAFRNGGESAEDLIRNADLAMYTAKSGGKSRFERFVPAMHARSVSRLQLANDLRRAIDANELRLMYQPILTLDGDSFAGAEALIRWQHPTRGFLGPGEFIDIAEETGLIVPIGAWVLEEACRELRLWQHAHTGREPLTVAVNLSGRQFGSQLVGTVEQTLRTYRIDPAQLTLEVTEGLISDDGPNAQKTLRDLKELGVWLAMDDFGTGHSSLGRLREYAFDQLKIDRRFVSDLDTGDPTLVSTQIAMAHGLGMDVVAEGVETHAQLAYLRAAGCAHVQGYYISRPVDSPHIRELLSGAGEWREAADGVQALRLLMS